jgi:hypothetical protein
MELEDAVHTALLTLKEGFEGGPVPREEGGPPARMASRAMLPASSCGSGWVDPPRSLAPGLTTLRCPLRRHAGELSSDNIEVAIVGEDRKFRVLTPAEVADYLREVE